MFFKYVCKFDFFSLFDLFCKHGFRKMFMNMWDVLIVAPNSVQAEGQDLFK